MLGVGLHKLCPLDSFGVVSENRKLSENRPPGGAEPARGGSKMACGRPPDGSFAPVGPNLAAKAARKPSLGGSGSALGTLLALLDPSWGLLGRSWGVPGRSWAPLGDGFGISRVLIWTIWVLSVAQREIQQKHRILRCFRASWASRRAPKALQNLGRRVGPEIGLEGPS